MRKILFLCLLMAACNKFKTNDQLSRDLIKKYLDSSLNNPQSYESVSFGKLYKLKDTIAMFEGKPDTVRYNGWYQIEHTYRATNQFGAIITKSEWFQIDSPITKAMCCFSEPLSYYK